MIVVVKSYLQKAWVRLKSIPTWLWAILGWAIAFFVYQSSRLKEKKAEVKSETQTKRQQSLTRRTKHLDKIKQDLANALTAAEHRHKEQESKLEEKEQALNDISGDTSQVADVVNDAFGGEE